MVLYGIALLGVGWCSLPAASADQSVERVALMVAGDDCAVYRESIRAVLASVPEVRRIEFDSIPDHILIDVETDRVTPEDLEATVSRRLGDMRTCRTEVMKSCISARQPRSSP